jgi:methylphosphotriester-DNA--protein-cysteine methyltransferase
MLALAQAADPESPSYHGNVRSKIFHRAGCRYYNCGNCVAVFATRQEALQAGYRPCKICKP